MPAHIKHPPIPRRKELTPPAKKLSGKQKRQQRETARRKKEKGSDRN